jgi:hypothetical protein
MKNFMVISNPLKALKITSPKKGYRPKTLMKVVDKSFYHFLLLTLLKVILIETFSRDLKSA